MRDSQHFKFGERLIDFQIQKYFRMVWTFCMPALQLASAHMPGRCNEYQKTISEYIDGYNHETRFICNVLNTDDYQLKKHLRVLSMYSIEHELSL